MIQVDAYSETDTDIRQRGKSLERDETDDTLDKVVMKYENLVRGTSMKTPSDL